MVHCSTNIYCYQVRNGSFTVTRMLGHLCLNALAECAIAHVRQQNDIAHKPINIHSNTQLLH
jgi:hypothetical protein